VEELRRLRRQPDADEWLVVSVADPLNLAGFVAALPRTPPAPSRRLVFRNGVVVAAETNAGIDWRAELSAAEQRRAAELLAPGLPTPPLRRVYGLRRR
jgi:ATP-dependent Lhr-like helicase